MMDKRKLIAAKPPRKYRDDRGNRSGQDDRTPAMNHKVMAKHNPKVKFGARFDR